MDKRELILVGCGYSSAIALSTDNSVHVVQCKEEDKKKVIVGYKAPEIPAFEEIHKYIDVFSTGKQRRIARRKAERDAKKPRD